MNCQACGGWGRVRVTGCLLERITPDVRRLVYLSHFAAKGQLPIGGGVLDQAQSFLDAHTTYQSLIHKHGKAQS